MMPQPSQHITRLIWAHLNGDATDTQERELAAWIAASPRNSLFMEGIYNGEDIPRWMQEEESDVQSGLQQLLYERVLRQVHAEKGPATVHRIHFIKTAWFRYAAILLLIAGTVAYFYTSSWKDPKVTKTTTTLQPQNILPGGNKARLTLADGTTITLDSAANGAIAQQGNSSITKLANGQIRYDLKGTSQGEVLLNTMATPRGGQYQLVLPDGTKAWLNAASSITYPAAFVERNRTIKVTGEVYLEVVQNKAKPFIVDVAGKSSIEVLGTSFNINSYENESAVRTTLVAGSVRVNKQVVLRPGQQAVQTLSSDQPLKITDADLSQTLAWKEGVFDFNRADLKTVMRQLERWYDIEVEYKEPLSNITFEGKMYRSESLPFVLAMLKKMGVRFELNGKTLTVF